MSFSGVSLELRELVIGVADKRLAAGISLALVPGDIVAITGPSGSGKTTLLRTVAALIDAWEGVIVLDGKTPRQIGYPTYRRRVSYVAQRSVLIAGTVRDNLALPFRHASAGDAELDDEEVQRLFERLGLSADVATQDARTLSEGQRQRVCLARALLCKPDVLLLDEPTSALDDDNVHAAERVIRETGAAALLVSHAPEQIERLAGATLELSDHG